MTGVKLYAFVTLLTAISSAAVGIFGLIAGRGQALHQAWFFFTIAIGGWHLGYFLTMLPTYVSKDIALASSRISHAFGILIPAFFLQFTVRLCPSLSSRRHVVLVSLAYLSCITLAALCLTPYIVIDLVPKLSLPLYPVGQLGYGVYVAVFGFWIILVHFLLIRELNRSLAKRNQILYVLLATVPGFIGGASCFPLIFGVPVSPFASSIIFISPLLITYAIVQHKLMDIEVVIKRTLVFAGLFAMVMGVVALVTGVSQNYLARYLAVNTAVSTIVGVGLAILLYDPTRRFLVRVTDRFLFQKRVSIREVLKALSERIITILDLSELTQTILATFHESLRCESGALLLKNETGYGILDSFGLAGEVARRACGPDDPLLKYLRESPQVVCLELEEEAKRLPTVVLAGLEQLKAVVAIPLFLHGELIGLLTLGRKKSDQEYTQEELDYFPQVASQVTIALANARHHNQVVEARKKIEEMQLELLHREKMAFVSDLVKGIAHELFNPLLPVYQKIEELERDILVGLFRIYQAEGGCLSPATRDEYFKLLKQLNQVAETLKVNTQHIHLVIDTLNKMQKEDKETIGPLDFKMFLKDSRALIGMELHSDNREVPIEEDVPRGLPPIKGNPTLLKQVFVNLFKNSIHAMQTATEKKITIKARLDPEDDHFLRIDFSDTGRGIPADILPKIFDFGFTTKGSGGQGIGLNQCKLIIERFGGLITCASEPGSGTTLTLKLPVWKETSGAKDLNRG